MYKKDDERMHLEADLENVLCVWVSSAISNMTLQELKDVTKQIENKGLTEIRVRNPRRNNNDT